MQIKRYEAKTMQAALAAVKRELGSSAVVLSVRTLKKEGGMFGAIRNAGVEVTAAIDNTARTTSGFPANNAYKPVISEQLKKKGPVMVEKPGYSKPRPALNLAGRSSAKHKTGIGATASMDKALDPVYQQLRGQGVEPGLARQILSRVKSFSEDGQNISPQELTQILSRIAFHLGGTANPLDASPASGRVIAFVGPTGVGKTTTLAKIAMAQALHHQRKVAIVTTDIHRIAAIEQIKVFTKLLGVSLDIAVDQRELRQIVAGHEDKDLIFVDTPGINVMDQEQVDMLANLICGVPNLEVHLLLSATTKNADMALLVKKFQSLFVKGLIFTKLDETNSYGNILNTLVKSKLPLSAMTTGQRIPEDFENGRLETLMERLLDHFGAALSIPKSHDAPDAHPQPPALNTAGGDTPQKNMEPAEWIANRNSDVFHHRQCKWAQRIKPDHVIMFTNIGQALKKGFSPCRSCARDIDNVEHKPLRGGTHETRNLRTLAI